MKKEKTPMKDPKEKILALAPLAVKEVERILEDDHSPPNARVQAIDIILNRTFGKPEGILKAENGLLVKTAAGEYAADGVFVLREAVAPGQLVPGLETDGAHVKVNRKMETNLPGVFACGDLTGTPYQYVKAAGEGNVAAISAAAYIDKKAKE